MRFLKYIAACTLGMLCLIAHSQTGMQKGNMIRLNLSDDGKEFIRFTFLNQTWLRYTDANPGTMVNGYAQQQIVDIGLRRTRMQLFGQISPRVFFYTQFGMNNFTYNSKQFQGAFFHDAVTEFNVHDKMLSLGAGLTGWSGLARYASPATGSILTLDAPLYQQTTSGINDQLLRKLSLYAKGKLGKLDYRVALTKPMAVQNAIVPINSLNVNADFSPEPAKLQSQGYFMYQFADPEDNVVPYTAGSYLGKKKVINLGAGFIYQPDAMWNLAPAGDTAHSDMLLLGADFFTDLPLNKEKQNAVTCYVAYNYFNLGPNYIRNIGVMNPANGVNSSGSFNGAGNAFPMVGTGSTLYVQLAYLMKKELLGKGTLQFYGATQVSDFDRMQDNIVMYEFGFNWLINGTNNSKLSLNYQGRPVFNTAPDGTINYSHHRGMIQLQYQIMI
ncbi:MAG: hypothetical protein HYZ14_04365 [Bacteroidetes bacterium]|nr:hypothetical protein [Bacteroidota bacterium]